MLNVIYIYNIDIYTGMIVFKEKTNVFIEVEVVCQNCRFLIFKGTSKTNHKKLGGFDEILLHIPAV